MRISIACLLVACAHTGTTGGGGDTGGGGGGFRVFFHDSKAKVGKHFQAKPAAECRYDNGNDARWVIAGAKVESGTLPPGLAIEDGAINGVPTQAGTYSAKIEFSGVTCAGKQVDDQHVDITLTVK